MKVLVIGGAGYVGAHAAKALKAAGHEPVVYDDLSAGRREGVRWGPLVVGDVRDRAALDACFDAHRPDAVMHFAARIEVGEGERDPVCFYEANVSGAIALAGAMTRAGVRPAILSSTCAVYGEAQRLPLTEDHPRAPYNAYGRTKLAMEMLFEDAARAGLLDVAALRYFNAAGASPDREIGEEHEPETHLIPNALKAAAGLGDGLVVFGDDYDTPDGTCVRDYIHVDDLARAHVAALERLSVEGGALACNLGAGRGVSVKQVIDAVAAATGRTVPHRIAARRPGDAPVLVADPSAAERRLGFTPQRSAIETIVADAWAYHAPRWGVA